MDDGEPEEVTARKEWSGHHVPLEGYSEKMFAHSMTIFWRFRPARAPEADTGKRPALSSAASPAPSLICRKAESVDSEPCPPDPQPQTIHPELLHSITRVASSGIT
jgi:hypothetical protein